MMVREKALTLVRPDVDCIAITRTRFDPSRAKRPFDGQGLTYRVGPNAVKDTPLDWFYPPRSMVEGLRLAFGEQWRIDLLPSTQEDAGLFLLTQQWTGWRLMVRLGLGGYSADPITVPAPPRPNAEGGSPVGDWCSDVVSPRGEDLREAVRYAVSTAVRRKGWLARAVQDSSVAVADLRAMMRVVGIRPEQPVVAGDGLDECRLLCRALVEVWLAENGYTDVEAAAIRTMIALRGLDALDSYERSTVKTAHNGEH